MELALFLFSKRFHIQVAVRLEPTFVDLNRQRPDEPETILRVGEDTDHMGPALELLIESLQLRSIAQSAFGFAESYTDSQMSFVR